MLFLLRCEFAGDLLLRGAEGNVAFELDRCGVFRGFRGGVAVAVRCDRRGRNCKGACGLLASLPRR